MTVKLNGKTWKRAFGLAAMVALILCPLWTIASAQAQTLTGRWVAMGRMLHNGEQEKSIVELKQNGTELTGTVHGMGHHLLSIHLMKIITNSLRVCLLSFAVLGDGEAQSLDRPKAPGGEHREMAKVADGTEHQKLDMSLSGQAGQSPVWRINSGGAATGAFIADCHVSGGRTGNSSATVDVRRVSSPAPEAVYQSERFGDFTYTVAGLTTGAFYTVRMHFAELHWNRAGARVFHVTINGTSALSNYDIFAAAGADHAAVVEEFTTKPDDKSAIKIVYESVVDHATSSGFEILRSPTPPNTPIVKSLPDPPVAWSPDGSRYFVNKEDQKDIFQLYVGKRGDKEPTCVTSTQVPGGPRPDRHKYMATWHPSSKWIVIGAERAEHDKLWIPAFLRKGWIECGIWMDIYATTPDGTQWHKLADVTGGFTGWRSRRMANAGRGPI